MSRRTHRFIPVATMLAMAVSGFAMAAQQATSTDAGHHRPMVKLDANHDGAIDRAEAASHPRLLGHFDRMDKNSDGKLDATERTRRSGKHDHRGHRDGMAHAIRLDTDGDGRISTIEASESKLAARFGTIDRNRDGYLVRSELQAEAEQQRRGFAAKRQRHFEEMFSAADGNRDGKLSRAEVEAHMPRHAKAFAFLDENRDGFLTRADLQPAPRR